MNYALLRLPISLIYTLIYNYFHPFLYIRESSLLLQEGMVTNMPSWFHKGLSHNCPPLLFSNLSSIAFNPKLM